MRRKLAALESQRALEHERLRIAQDIHDDLGARVTQISLVSGLAQSDDTLSAKTRAEFNTISGMARELVSALYETVWAVNPENDNLDALGNFVCQMVDNLCDKAQLRRRFRVAELPRDFQVSSHVRHNLIMAVKEAVHNAIKHAKASELSVSLGWQGTTLTIRVQDGGCGFQPAGVPPAMAWPICAADWSNWEGPARSKANEGRGPPFRSASISSFRAEQRESRPLRPADAGPRPPGGCAHASSRRYS